MLLGSESCDALPGFFLGDRARDKLAVFLGVENHPSPRHALNASALMVWVRGILVRGFEAFDCFGGCSFRDASAVRQVCDGGELDKPLLIHRRNQSQPNDSRGISFKPNRGVENLGE